MAHINTVTFMRNRGFLEQAMNRLLGLICALPVEAQELRGTQEGHEKLDV